MLSLYAFADSKTFAIEKILALGEKLIFAIAISPHDENRCISISADGFLLHWDISQAAVTNRLPMQPNTPSLLEWDAFSPDRCLVAINRRNGALPPVVALWNSTKLASSYDEILFLPSTGLYISLFSHCLRIYIINHTHVHTLFLARLRSLSKHTIYRTIYLSIPYFCFLLNSI